MSSLSRKVVVFACSYCGYTAADLAGSMRLEQPTSVRIVRLMCTGRTDPVMLLRTLHAGADAAVVVGCQRGDCHYQEGNMRAKAVVQRTKELVAEVGLEPGRLEFFHIAASEAHGWVSAVEEMTERARRLGPNPLRSPQSRQGSVASMSATGVAVSEEGQRES